MKQKWLTGGKRGKFVYLACPTNPLKGPELSTLNFGRTLVFGVSRPGMAQFILNTLICCMNRTNDAHRMHRLMCIFVISRFQTTFLMRWLLFLKFIVKILKGKTSILSLGQIIKMCYCRIHVHIHAWTAPWLNTFSALTVNLAIYIKQICLSI